MELDLTFERFYPHPIEIVWEAVSSQEGLSGWLMENDFQPELGREFQFRFCPDEQGAETSTVYAQVLELEPPHRMVWSWRNEHEDAATRVEITLSSVDGGTRFTLRHRGPISEGTGRTLESGWPEKLASLGGMLGASR